MTVAAPAAKVWDMLLDPVVMGSCAPGMKSIEVVSPTEYIAVMHVKISFVSARFRLKTRIVEQRAPHYLRSEGTGEDSAVGSSLKQNSEIFLVELPDGRTELRMKAQVEVLGRLGSFGLSVMKTKADRLWEEFGQNLKAKLEGQGVEAAIPAPSAAAPPMPVPAEAAAPAATTGEEIARAGEAAPAGWLARLISRVGMAPAAGRNIRIDIKRADATITVHWPVEDAAACAALLREALGGPGTKP